MREVVGDLKSMFGDVALDRQLHENAHKRAHGIASARIVSKTIGEPIKKRTLARKHAGRGA